MRDVKRIRPFLESVAEVWETHPDLRFGQLVCNVITNETMRFYIKARKKILLLGNHDARGVYKNLFDEIYSGPLFISDKILLSHEPVYGLPWCLNIHGHDHNGMEAYHEGCKHINLAANVCGYTPINLGKIIKNGILSDIDNIHRQTIDRAVEKKEKREASVSEL